MKSISGISIIILAAGSSSRLGSPKQSLHVGNTSLLTHTCVQASKSIADHIMVVLGSGADIHKTLIPAGIDTIINEDWEKGMGSSLKLAIRHIVQNKSSIKAIMILVCDQPLLNYSHLNKLITTYQSSPTLVIASAYSNTMGVPALFDKSVLPELLEIADHEGAKKIIQKHASTLVTVAYPEGSIDIDTPEDYQRFLKM